MGLLRIRDGVVDLVALDALLQELHVLFHQQLPWVGVPSRVVFQLLLCELNWTDIPPERAVVGSACFLVSDPLRQPPPIFVVVRVGVGMLFLPLAVRSA